MFTSLRALKSLTSRQKNSYKRPGFASSIEYRQSLSAYLEIIRKYEVKRWLGDYRKARVVRPVDQEWAIQVWAPAFFPLTTDIEKMAKVNSLDVANQISSDKMRDDLDVSRLPFVYQDFDSYEPARTWVLS